MRVHAWAALVALALLGPACGQRSVAQVLQVNDINPRQIEVGERVEVLGHDFPSPADIRRISVTFRGTLARPGAEPCPTPVEVTLSDPPPGATIIDAVTGQSREATYAESTSRQIRVEGSSRLEFVVTEELLRRLARCPGERGSPELSHATLSLGGPGARNSPKGVTVRIEGLTSGVAIAGTLRGPTLDLHGPSSRRLGLNQSARREAERALDFMGLTLAPSHPSEGGLRVAGVRAGSPAERAGVLPNDVLVRLDGLNLLALDDFRPAPGVRSVTLTTLRGDVQDERDVSMEGFAPVASGDFALAAVLLLAIALLLLLAIAPMPGVLVWLRRYGSRGAARGHPHEGFFAWLARALRAFPTFAQGAHERGEARALFRAAPMLVLAALATTVMSAPFGHPLIACGLDLGAFYFTAAALLAALAVAWASCGSQGRFSLLEGVRAAARVASHHVPAAAALTCAIASAGTVRMRGLVEAQGGWPWEWNLFRSPMTVVLGAGFATALLARARDTDAGRAGVAAAAVEWGHALAMALVGSAALLGGWQVPGATSAEVEASVPLQMLGASFFLAKTWACMFGTLAMRRALGHVHSAQAAAFCRRHAAPWALAALAPAIGWALWSPRLHPLAQDTMAAATFVACALAVAWWRWGRRFVALEAERAAYVPDPFA